LFTFNTWEHPSMTAKVLVFSGSARTDSHNKQLALAAAHALQTAGAGVTLIDLADFPMPIYNADLEAKDGVPETARELKALFVGHNALLICSPENNASVTALLKNTLDWVSRPDAEHDGRLPYRNKVAALVAASPGALGGLRGLVHLRAILQTLGVLVLSEQFALSRAHEAFAADGRLIDAKHQASLDAVAQRLVEVCSRLSLV
jgi:chromate reductase, NAD(P)H dehydrogenase (quinone)